MPLQQWERGMTHDPERPYRRSIRLKEYDYLQPNAYFITICAYNKECIFGGIIDARMILNELGKIVWNEWNKTAQIRKNVNVDEYVVMPNHMHGILMIIDGCDVGETRRVAPTERPKGPAFGSVGAIIGQFKSIATKRINALRGTPGLPVWQRNYYEHIIRNEKDLDEIREYIINNPIKWDLDEENLRNIKVGGVLKPAPTGKFKQNDE